MHTMDAWMLAINDANNNNNKSNFINKSNNKSNIY